VPPELNLSLRHGSTLRLSARTGGFTIEANDERTGRQTVSFGRLNASRTSSDTVAEVRKTDPAHAPVRGRLRSAECPSFEHRDMFASEV
jgi:hypothetical protein